MPKGENNPEQLQLFFDRTLKSKQEIKEITAMIKDRLEQSEPFKMAYNELEKAKAKLNTIKTQIMEEFGVELDKMDTLKVDINNDKQLMTDTALSKLIKGEELKVADKYGNEYEPVFNITFKKLI